MLIKLVECVAEERKDEALVQPSGTITLRIAGILTLPFIACFPEKKTNQNPEGALFIWGEFTLRSK